MNSSPFRLVKAELAVSNSLPNVLPRWLESRQGLLLWRVPEESCVAVLVCVGFVGAADERYALEIVLSSLAASRKARVVATERVTIAAAAGPPEVVLRFEVPWECGIDGWRVDIEFDGKSISADFSYKR